MAGAARKTRPRMIASIHAGPRFDSAVASSEVRDLARMHQLDRQRQIASGRRRLDGHFVRTERNVNARRQPRFAFGPAIDRQLRFRRVNENAVALTINRRVKKRHSRVR